MEVDTLTDNEQEVGKFLFSIPNDGSCLSQIQTKIFDIYNDLLVRSVYNAHNKNQNNLSISTTIKLLTSHLSRNNISIVILSFNDTSNRIYIEKCQLSKHIEYFRLLLSDNELDETRVIYNVIMDSRVNFEIMNKIINAVTQQHIKFDFASWDKLLIAVELLITVDFLLYVSINGECIKSRLITEMTWYDEIILLAIIKNNQPETAYSMIHSFCNIITNHKSEIGKKFVSIIFYFETLLSIDDNKDLFFNSQLFKYLLNCDKQTAENLAIKYQHNHL